MNKEQYEEISKAETVAPAVIRLTSQCYGGELRDPKTLLYGYDCDRNTHHVFQDGHGNIYLHLYVNMGTALNSNKELSRVYKSLVEIDVTGDGVKTLEDLLPNKRLYPQYCDYKFCAYLKSQGVTPNFTVWDEPTRDPGMVFVGEIF